MRPPDRFAAASFDAYHIHIPGQATALKQARDTVDEIRRGTRPLERLKRRMLRARRQWSGLYLVGPVGTGKTHLLASMYHRLHPEVPCAFMHSSALFRNTDHPAVFARRLARSYRVLCLDEIEIDDPANEARLVAILRTLDRLGVTLLATSNVDPERFLATHVGNDRFRRFLNEEFRQRHRVIFVGGNDYRRGLHKTGMAWIGPRDETRLLLKARFDADGGTRCWMDFDHLLRAATEVEHTRLVRQLTSFGSLYVADIDVRGTDDALRLLRIVDDLYQAPSPPVLYFTSPAPVDAWFAPADRRGVEGAIAEKFGRTLSRLHALCDMHIVECRESAA
jgi:cell division protein ZapE